MRILSLFCLFTIVLSILFAQKPSARDIGIPFYGNTGKYNAITDVKGEGRAGFILYELKCIRLLS